MIAEFQCQKDGEIIEEYFPTFSSFKKEENNRFCPKCKTQMKRIFGRAGIKMDMIGKDLPGYEKEAQGKLTLGKAVDSLQKWY